MVREKRVVILFLLSLAFGINAMAVDVDPFAIDAAEDTALLSDSSPVVPEIQFDNDDITLAFQIISDATSWSIFPSEKASKKKISLWAKNITAAKLLEKVVTLSELVMDKQGNVISVMAYDEYVQYYNLERRVVKLEHGKCEDVVAILKPFMTKFGKVVAYVKTNSVVLYETAANLEAIIDVIAGIDFAGADSCIEVLDLQYGDSKVLAEKLMEIFSDKELKEATETVVSGNVNIYSIDRTSQLVVKGRRDDIDQM